MKSFEFIHLIEFLKIVGISDARKLKKISEGSFFCKGFSLKYKAHTLKTLLIQDLNLHISWEKLEKAAEDAKQGIKLHQNALTVDLFTIYTSVNQNTLNP